MKRHLLLACLSLLSVAACPGSTPDTAPDTPPDTGCTPEGEPLLGDALVMCAAGEKVDGYCTSNAEYSVWTTLSCTDYAGHGWQVLWTLAEECADGRNASCCDCRYELTAECNPCTVND